MSPGACRACVIERSCCGECWCCPWPTKAIDRAKVLPGIVRLLHRRPELASRGWDDGKATLGAVLVEWAVSGA